MSHERKTLRPLPDHIQTEQDMHKRVFQLKNKHLRQFLTELKMNGRSDNTVSKYKSSITSFYEFLDEDKWVYTDTLKQWRQELIDRAYAPRTVNASVIAVNTLYNCLGYRNLQCFDWMEIKDEAQEEEPELTRAEYLSLLREAKRQENMQLYLMVKVFACTELNASNLSLLTREAVNEGGIAGKFSYGRSRIVLPGRIREELLQFTIWREIRSGSVFLGTGGKPVHRSLVFRMLTQLGVDIGLEPGKVSVRSLNRMYQKTRATFQEQADIWVEQKYQELLEQEEELLKQ